MELIRFNVNDQPVTVTVDADRSLLRVLRDDLHLTGAKPGCGAGQCGACVVLLDGRAVRSCMTKAMNARDRSVTTIEGLARNGRLHPVQQAFVEEGSIQCGYCSPGMILTAVSLLNANPNPTDDEIRTGMERQLCRCGSHLRILRAVRSAAAMLRTGGQP